MGIASERVSAARSARAPWHHGRMDERVDMDGEPGRVLKAIATERGTEEEVLAKAALRRSSAKSQEPPGAAT